MGHIPIARAEALPGGAARTASGTPWGALTRHAGERGDDVAFVILGEDGETASRTWSEVHRTVEQAAAGLIRSGLRLDQVVLSLLPADHPYPELDLALRTIGAVVVHVAADAGDDDLVRELADAHVRLVVAEHADDVARLSALPLASTELFALDGGRGWATLLELGAERLVMDPAAVERADRVVDPSGAGPRLLAAGLPLSRVAGAALRGGVLDQGAVTLLAGDVADPMGQVVREAHLDLGFTLCAVQGTERVEAAATLLRPTVLAASAAAAVALPHALSDAGARPARVRRPRGRRQAGVTRLPAASVRGPLVVAPALPDGLHADIAALAVVEVVEPQALPADLPQPPEVVMGDVADLPRRARRTPGDDFGLRLTPARPDASAFLPSLPLMSGESFLDKLLLARAEQAHR